MTGGPGRDLDRRPRLWLARVDDPEVRRAAAAYADLLPPEERRRLERFRSAPARDEYLLGRALARTALSRHSEIPPAAWRFRPGRRGRPEIVGPASAPSLRFNLAHSHGLVACLVTGDAGGGVDVESPGRRARIDLLAERYLSAAERARLPAAPEPARREAFLHHWTLKEAYLKARGLGIALPLRSLTFHIDGARLRAEFAEPVDDDPGRWRFDLYRAPGGFLVATALPGSAGAPRVGRSAPLGSTSDAGVEHLASSAAG